MSNVIPRKTVHLVKVINSSKLAKSNFKFTDLFCLVLVSDVQEIFLVKIWICDIYLGSPKHTE